MTREYDSIDDLFNDNSTPEEGPEVLDESTEETVDETPEEETDEPEEVAAEADDEDDGKENPENSEAEEEAEEDPEKPEDGKEKEPEKPAVFTVKVDGVEKEVDSDELVRGYQLASASYARFQEASQLEKGAKTVLEKIQQDPFNTLLDIYTSRTGDYKQAEDHLLGVIQNFMQPYIDSLTSGEDAARAAQYQRHNEYLQRQHREALQRQQKLEADQRAQAFVARIRADLPKELAAAGLPQTEDIERQVIDQFRQAKDAAYDLTVRDAVLQVKQLQAQVSEAVLPTLSVEELIKRRPDLAEAIRQADLESRKSKSPRKTPTSHGKPAQKQPRRRSNSKREVSISEAFDQL